MITEITKETSLKDAEELLNFHRIQRGLFDMFIIGLLLNSCDRIQIEGFGKTANFNLITD